MSQICRNPFSLFILALFCMLLATPIRASTQHHHHHNHQNRHSNAASENAESPTQIENNNLTVDGDKELTTTQGNAPENGSGNDDGLLNVPMEEENRGIGSGKTLFREYLDRGMLTCSTKYFGILRKLNKLISTAHAEYTACQRMAEKADRSGQSAAESRKLAAQLDMINELLND